MEVVAIEMGVTAPKKIAVLCSAAAGNINPCAAAQGAGVSPPTVYGWLGRITGRERLRDDNFTRAFDVAIQIGIEAIEAIAIERAKEKSDKLMMFMLKAWKPEKYGELKDFMKENQGTQVVIELKDTRDE